MDTFNLKWLRKFVMKDSYYLSNVGVFDTDGLGRVALTTDKYRMAIQPVSKAVKLGLYDIKTGSPMEYKEHPINIQSEVESMASMPTRTEIVVDSEKLWRHVKIARELTGATSKYPRAAHIVTQSGDNPRLLVLSDNTSHGSKDEDCDVAVSFLKCDKIEGPDVMITIRPLQVLDALSGWRKPSGKFDSMFTSISILVNEEDDTGKAAFSFKPLVPVERPPMALIMPLHGGKNDILKTLKFLKIPHDLETEYVPTFTFHGLSKLIKK